LSNPARYPQGFATAGAISGMSATSGNPYFNLPGGAKMFGVYFQDDWKVNHKLSLSLGMRWDKDYNLIGSKAQAQNRTFLNIPLFMIQQANPTIFSGVFAIASSGPGDANADFVPGTGIRLSNFRFGIDPLPVIPPPQTQLAANNTGRIMDPDYQNPFTQQW
ncbi:MAG: hypothetical protein ABR501_15220, partial [Pyrinomonadaceae bacterium]